MFDTNQAKTLVSGGGNVLDSNGDKIGSIGQVFLDDSSGRPEWVTVNTGLFGMSESFVPLRDAELSGKDVRVPYTKDKVKDAPRISDAESHLDESEEAKLYTYYGVEGQDYDTSYSDTGTTTGTTTGTGYATTDTTTDRDVSSVGHDTSGPNTDSAMTRSEEQVRVGTETREAGRARLRKYVVTEDVQTTVPVSHEEVRIEREPITDANRGEAMSGGDITTEEHDVVLNEERVVVDKETVPVERVRVDKETVTEQERVDETVRKEQIELDEDGTTGTTGTVTGDRRND
ncbi:MAG TPA: PRC and DUF2382 domain-containing protein [Nocardioides sp.]|nr:PRC and DUF2382 domain-containing protein [Nocardioides sp.]